MIENTQPRLHDRAFLAPYVIAEIGVNHEGSLTRAKAMIEQVASAGAHAAKFQTYKADLIASPSHSPSYWDESEEPATSQHALFKRYDAFGEKDYQALANCCAACGIDFLSTPFDLGAVDMLAPLMPAVKVASADITNIPLLRKVGQSAKPVIMSTGAASMAEIDIALEVLEHSGARDITLLHCVLNYPTPKAHAQMAQLEALQKRYARRWRIGYSDHVKPEADGSMPALEMAALQGARVIEKHFTDDKTARGNDHYHAMDAQDLRRFMAKLAQYRTLYGAGERDLQIQASAIQNARRRIIAAKPIAKGEALCEQNLIALRSHIGIEVSRWDEALGRIAAEPIAEGAPIGWAQLQ